MFNEELVLFKLAGFLVLAYPSRPFLVIGRRQFNFALELVAEALENLLEVAFVYKRCLVIVKLLLFLKHLD